MSWLPPRSRGRVDARRRGRRARSRAGTGEDGFILLESLVAISLITVLLAAVGGFTLRTVQATGDLRARQAAAQVATSTVATLTALPATDLLTGRDPTSVRAQFSAAPASVASSLTQMTQAFDVAAAAGAGATAAVPTSPTTQTLNNVTYSISVYLGTCVILTGATGCVPTGVGIGYLRPVVAVTWSGRGCSGGGTCSFVTSTLISADLDPVFNVNKAVPPVAPVIQDPGAQTSTVGMPVNVQLAVKPATGATPLVWALAFGSFPSGLTVSASGLVTGTPPRLVDPIPLTVSVTDVFGRIGYDSFFWQVVAKPTVTAPSTQTTVVGTAVTVPVTSTCPNSPCSFTLANAPAGLTINPTTGAISGTPTALGTSTTTIVTITDAAGAAVASTPFTWKVVTPPPTIGNPGTLATTVGKTVSIPIPYTCPVATCTITLTNAIPGLSLTTTDTTRSSSTTFGTPGSVDTTGTTNLSAGKTATQSSFAFNGNPARAVDGNTDGVYNDGSISHTDTQAQPWWQVDLGAASLVRAVRIWNRTDCCDTRLSNFYVFTSPTDMSGRTAAQLLADPTVAVQRISGLAGQPSITIPAQSNGRYVRVQLSGSDYLSLAEVQVLGTVDTGTSITVGASSGTVYATGVVPASAVPSGTSKGYTPSLAITDFTGTTVTSTTGAWTVFTPPTVGSPGTRSMTVLTSPNVAVPYTCPNAPCTLALAGGPAGLGLSTTTGVTTANSTASLTLPDASGTVYVNGLVSSGAVPSGTSKVYTPTLTITDNASVPVAATGSWTVLKGPSLTNPGSQVVQPGNNVSLQMTATCPNGGCTWTASAQFGSDPTWYAAPISASGVLGTQNPPTGAYTVRVNVTDAAGVSDTVTFPLTVQAFALTVPNQQTTKPSSGTKTVQLNIATLVSPSSTGYTYSIAGAPAWVSLDASTGVITATISSTSASDPSMTVTATSIASPTSSVSSTFGWTLQ